MQNAAGIYINNFRSSIHSLSIFTFLLVLYFIGIYLHFTIARQNLFIPHVKPYASRYKWWTNGAVNFWIRYIRWVKLVPLLSLQKVIRPHFLWRPFQRWCVDGVTWIGLRFLLCYINDQHIKHYTLFASDKSSCVT